MKSNFFIPCVMAACLLGLSQNSFAYETDEPEEVCKIPKVLEFSLPEYDKETKHEVPAEADFTFRITGRGADHRKVQVTAKGKPLALDISKNSSFISVKGKLLPEFSGQFVRFDVQVGTDLGCRAKVGWLVKVAGAAAAPATEPAPAASTPVAEQAAAPATTEQAANAPASTSETPAAPAVSQ